MITDDDRICNQINIAEDQFKFTCIEMLKYGMLDEYFFKKAIEEICVDTGSSKSLIDEVLMIKNVYSLGDSLNKKFIESMNNKTDQLETMVNEDTYSEFKELIETAVYSVVVVNEESLANEIYLELHEEKMTMDEISSELADDQIVEMIQDIGPVFISNVHPVVKKSIRSIQNIEGVSRPVFVHEGWMVILLKQYNKPPNNSNSLRGIAIRKIEEEARLIAEKSLEIFKSTAHK